MIRSTPDEEREAGGCPSAAANPYPERCPGNPTPNSNTPYRVGVGATLRHDGDTDEDRFRGW
jgi:hypothetical protein